MLHDARMAGLAKLRRSIRSTDERQLRAVHVGRGEIVWQDRCDAANGSKEPNVPIAAETTNGSEPQKLTFKVGTVTRIYRQKPRCRKLLK
ncbi:MAG: hypothetical protein ACI9TZ_003444 [Yoonia sp.]|jgi:hypothetical protein